MRKLKRDSVNTGLRLKGVVVKQTMFPQGKDITTRPNSLDYHIKKLETLIFFPQVLFARQLRKYKQAF